MSEPREKWPRYDPRVGIWLCHSCWNLVHKCAQDDCDCPRCTRLKPPPKPKFTGEGQLQLVVPDELAKTEPAWPRIDPALGYRLCRNCWNRGPAGLKHRCTRGDCTCPCTLHPAKRRSAKKIAVVVGR